MRVMQFISSSL